ncbi:MAG TPA: hypothetical protein VHY59_08310, partial [Chthoniobacterales bacterium]|nr:hypothetical protein [Chthoniobacterales bacterium]
QKWYVESFIDSAFSLHRHSCANAAMKVYGLSHKRSRQLYEFDLTRNPPRALGRMPTSADWPG